LSATGDCDAQQRNSLPLLAFIVLRRLSFPGHGCSFFLTISVLSSAPPVRGAHPALVSSAGGYLFATSLFCLRWSSHARSSSHIEYFLRHDLLRQHRATMNSGMDIYCLHNFRHPDAPNRGPAGIPLAHRWNTVGTPLEASDERAQAQKKEACCEASAPGAMHYSIVPPLRARARRTRS
jgi:hypothetical protein